jgi:hypothetical protein
LIDEDFSIDTLVEDDKDIVKVELEAVNSASPKFHSLVREFYKCGARSLAGVLLSSKRDCGFYWEGDAVIEIKALKDYFSMNPIPTIEVLDKAYSGPHDLDHGHR